MNSASWKRRWRRLETHAAGVACALLALSLALVLGGAAWVLRSQEIDDWSRALDQLSLALAHNTAHSISASGLALDRIVAVLPTDNDALLRGDALQRTMRDKIGNVPQVIVASIVGADGVLRNATHAWLATASDLPERNALAYHSMHSGPAHHLGVPVRSGIDGAWTVYLSRRLDTRGGRFAGVALVGISGASFAHLFHAIGAAQPVAISLASCDRTVLASWPRRDASIVNAFDASAAAGGAPMTARRPVPGYPLFVGVAVAHEQVLAGWWRRLPALGTVALVGMLGIGLTFAILVRRLRLRERDAVAAQASASASAAAATATAANETVRHATMLAGSRRAHAPGAETAAAQAATVAPRTSMKALRVLVVDDTDINRELLRILLAQLGCQVEEAADGAEALVALAAGGYDLVLMDCMMPVLDGYEACRRLRQREYATGAPRLAVVALTASAIDGERERCLAAGMDDYLSKPFTPQQLGELVRRWT